MSPVAAATTGSAAPTKKVFVTKCLIAAAGADVTSEGVVVPRTGYLTRAAFIAQATLTGADTESRTHTVVDPTTRVVTDGIVAVLGTAAYKGPWVSGSYSAGDIVTYNNQSYVAIASATTEVPGASPTKWTAVNDFGLDRVTSLAGVFTQDDVGKALAGTGFTSATILKVIDAQTVQTSSPNTAVRNGLSTTIGSLRTLATLAYTATPQVTATADVPKDLTLGLDTRVFKGDVIKVVSTHVGATGLADTGGVMQLEITSYGEGTG